jgi:mono/diheme cytochrome c family protein
MARRFLEMSDRVLRRFAIAITATLVAAGAVLARPATTPRADRINAGRAVALEACTACHIVAENQPFKPIDAGPKPPADFKTIANKSGETVQSLRHYLQSLPLIPKPGGMANPALPTDELDEVAAFIVSLRDKVDHEAQDHDKGARSK